ncbi:MAG: neutral zinc metallopeptidase, partial [Terrimicrobiaceae bacterium]
MKWTGRRQSSNVEDRRGMSPRGRTVIGGGLGLVLIIALAIFTDTDPIRLLDALSVEQGSGSATAQTPQDDDVRQFVSTVLADTEEV